MKHQFLSEPSTRSTDPVLLSNTARQTRSDYLARNLCGLSSAENERRPPHYGPSGLPESQTGTLRRLIRYCVGPIPWTIESATILSAVGRHWDDFAVIVALLAVNARIGVFEEQKADNANEALKQRLVSAAHVLSNGIWRDVGAKHLVPGDLIALKLGNIVPAKVERPGKGNAEQPRKA